MKKIVSFIISVALTLGAVPFASASGTSVGFSDLPERHWAYSVIMEMVDGGLVHGNGGAEAGTFAPNNSITIAEMATIISNAKGHNTRVQAGQPWYYEAVDYCVNKLFCLPKQGDGTINAENYDVPCTRQLAVHMMVRGLGINNGIQHATNETEHWTLMTIPGIGDVYQYWQDEVIACYQRGVLTGKPAGEILSDGSIAMEGEFDPNGLLTRAEMCAIFARAGWTTAAEAPSEGEGPALDALWESIKGMSGVTWTEGKSYGKPALTANERVYGGLTVRRVNENCISIEMPEYVRALCYNADGTMRYNVAGDPVPDIDVSSLSTTTWDSPTAYSYEARQLAKRILQLACPTRYEEAYMTIKSVMFGEAYESDSEHPKTVRWYDGRCIVTDFSDREGAISSSVSINIGESGREDGYNEYKLSPVSTRHYNPSYRAGNVLEHVITVYGLEQW